MSQLDAIVLSNAVKERLVNFALDSHFMQDTQLMQACRELWSGAPEMGGLLSDLWIEGAFPAKASGDALHDLVQQKKFHAGLCHHLDRKDVIPRHRPLYLHQRDAIIQAQETYPAHAKPALIVTAGTGAGKTESFLLPILNDLFNTSTQEEGVKCIILYPMNALVNDQVDRLYTWLEGQQRVTIFHFTGETPEDKTRANKDNIPTWDACRMRTRQEARGLETHAGKRIDLNTSSRGPVPDIIVTNYSMLEYMLCRPQDAIFFGKALRAIVLDEAHLYTGTLAAEITLLLRRLLERCGRSSEQILHIATSATIGGDTPGELESFAAKLFTKPQSLIQVIRGQSARIPLPNIAPPKGIPSYTEIVGCEWLARPTIEGDTELTVDAQYCRMLSEHLSLLVDEEIVLKEQHQAEDKPAILLRKVLGHAPLLHRIESILWQKQHLSLRDLTRQLWGVTDEEAMRATTIVLQMGASARSNVSDYPLLPNRIHMLARPTAGLVVCLNKDCTGKSTLKLANLGCIAEGLQDHCVYCQSATLSLYRCGNCGTWVMAGMYDATSTHLKPVPSAKLQTDIQYLTASPLPEFEEQIALDIVTGQCDGKGTNERTFYSIKEQRCPHCDNDNDEDWQPFAQYSSLTLSILTESVLAELPEYPAPYNLWLPARGRRMLVFSDSRQAAARLGPRLTRQHEIQLVRAAMVQCLRETPITDDAVLLDFQEDVDRLKNRLNRSTLTAPQRLQTERQLAEAQQKLTNAQVGDSLEHWIDAVVKVSILQELIDGETASNHDVDLWSKNMQAEWLTNAQYIHQKLKFLLAREFARPTQRQTSLETIGLAEITYPGLDQLTIPDLLAGTLPTTHAREQLRTCWTAFLAALCDTLRTDGAITLGSTGEDKEYTFSNLLGRWCIEGKEQARWVVSFTGETSRHRRRKFTTAVLQKCGLSTNEGDQYVTALLSAAFGQLKTNAGKAKRSRNK